MSSQSIWPNKKISVFRVTDLKNLGRVGTHIFFNHLFSGKIYYFMHFERPFKMHEIIFFSRKPDFFLGLVNLGRGG